MPPWTVQNIPSQLQKLAIVTGANSGIGKITALELARSGAHVILACRDKHKALAIEAEIKKDVPEARLNVEVLDLSSLKSVRDFSKRIIERSVPIDVLVNNAGLMMPPTRTTTEDGYELQLGVNHLGHFALTNLLMPALRSAPAARVVSVASVAHKRARIHFDDLQGEKKYDPYQWYGQSKLANLLFGFELERKLRVSHANPISLVAHPGVSRTRLFINGPGVLTHRIVNIVGQSEARGALPILFAATSPEAKGGRYYGPNGLFEYRGDPIEIRAKPQAYDEVSAQELWQISEKLTDVFWAP